LSADEVPPPEHDVKAGAGGGSGKTCDAARDSEAIKDGLFRDSELGDAIFTVSLECHPTARHRVDCLCWLPRNDD